MRKGLAASRGRAIQALTAYLPDAGSGTAEVAQALVELATTETTRRRAVQALTACLPHTTGLARAGRQLTIPTEP